MPEKVNGDKTFAVSGIVSASGYVFKYAPEAAVCRGISCMDVIRAVSGVSRIRHHEIFSKRKRKSVAHIRHLCYYICYTLCQNISLPEIGRFFSRDHTTILYGVEETKKRLKNDAKLLRVYERAMKALEGPSLSPRAPGRKPTGITKKFKSEPQKRGPKPREFIIRKCLKCRQPFKSEGGHQWLCRRGPCLAARENLMHELNGRAAL